MPGFVLLVHPRGDGDPAIRVGYTVTKTHPYATNRALKGHLQEAPLAAFLAEECQRGGAAAALSADALTAWVLAAALRRHQRSPGQSAIRSGLDAARLLKRKAPELLAQLSLTGRDMAGVAEELLALIPREDLPRVIRGYLQKIHYLLRVTLDDKDAIFRQVGERRPRALSDSLAPGTLLPVIPDSAQR